MVGWITVDGSVGRPAAWSVVTPLEELKLAPRVKRSLLPNQSKFPDYFPTILPP